MASTRRSFLQFAGLAPAAAAGLVAPAAFAASGTQAGAESNLALTRSRFAQCVGEEFQFEKGAFDHGNANLARIDGAGENSFSLCFLAATPGSIAQDSYRVTHARLGRFVMFVSPNDAEGRVVEAVFNRL